MFHAPDAFRALTVAAGCIDVMLILYGVRSCWIAGYRARAMARLGTAISCALVVLQVYTRIGTGSLAWVSPLAFVAFALIGIGVALRHWEEGF